MRISKLFCLMILITVFSIAVHAQEKRYVIKELGAVGDGKTVNTKVIQAAIDQCASDGGCVIVVPEGVFLSGAIFLKRESISV